MPVTPFFDEHMSRFLRSDPFGSEEKIRGVPAQGAQMPEPKRNIDSRIQRSLDGIGTLTQNYNAIQDNLQHFKQISEQYEQKLSAEKDINGQLARKYEDANLRLNDLQASLSSEQLRLRKAQDCIAALEEVLEKKASTSSW